MDFLAWHYSEGLRFYANRYVYLLKSVVHYFSLPILLTTLFAPWKRLVVTNTKVGFDLAVYFQNLSFNLVSRFMGAVVRIFLFVAGLLTLFLFFLFGSAGFIVWIILPFLSYGVFVKYRHSPTLVAKKLWGKLKGGKFQDFLNTPAGEFFVSHLGISAQKLLDNAKPINLTGAPGSFEEIIKIAVENGVWSETFLRSENIKKEDLTLTARWWDKKTSSELNLELPKSNYGGIGRDLLFGYTPLLKQYSTDMSMSTFEHHLIGRSEVVARIERNLTGGRSVILTGEPGVGKKTVVYEFAHKARRGEFGEELAYRKVLELDYNFVFSGSVDKNRKKQQLGNIFAEASAAGNIILVLHDLHRLTTTSLEEMDITDILETHLERGKLKIITISSIEDYEKFLARNSRLKKFFEVVEVKESTLEEAKEILLEAAATWENKKNLVITVPALGKILSGSDQYITDTPFPEKALELLDAVLFLEEQRGADKTITVEDVNSALSEKTGISFAKLDKDENIRLSNLEEIIHERLVNQEEAVNLIAKILRSKSLGVVNTKRPIGSFLFLGPTGVGKTETAKVLAKVYFGSEEKIIRFDMAEYVGREGLERLIGSLSTNQPGTLTTAIKNNPASLLLLDEIEKAPKEVYNLFLAMLDEGVITDAFGKKINCRNLFIIATSNAGAEYIREKVQAKEEGLQEKIVSFILEKGIFSPEFINRFDGVVVYEPLDSVHLIKVAQILLLELSRNMEEKNILLQFSEEAVKKLAEDGYEPEFGARPMRRIIELSIGDLLGKALLSGEIKSGDKVRVIPGMGKGEFAWEKK